MTRSVCVQLLSLLPVFAMAESREILPPLTVIGSQEAIRQQVGSAAFISASDLQSQNHFNVNRILERVPGVYLREEDGFGNFPNISIRGVDGTRSEKLTVMEDGVPAAPAIYTAPAAYFSPAAARMSGIEVLKGSSQVRFGPNTTGGVINYLSTPIPDASEGRLRYSFGSFNTHLLLLQQGGTVEQENGRFGYLFELLGQSSDGFRDLDGGGDTGFRRVEPMLKFSWEPRGPTPQRWEFKVGHTDFKADETYLGLTETDVRATPHRRYVSSRYDVIDTEHLRGSLRYTASPSELLDLESTFYAHRFTRSWYKLDHVSTESNPEIEKSGNIADRTALHQGLLESNPALGVLRGTVSGSIGVKDNNREYESIGWQNAFTRRFATGQAEHALTGGVRFHYDYEKRFQYVDVFQGDGSENFAPFRRGVPGEEADRKQETFATAVFLEDSIRMGALTLRPGVRGEFLRMDDNNRGKKADGTLETWAAGTGFTYDLTDSETIFGGVYRGIATPGPGAYLNNGVNVEESLSYELGLRHRQPGLGLELAGFHTDFTNLIGTDTGLGLADINQNAGEATVYGVEASIQVDPAARAGRGFRLPLYLSLTYTKAELEKALASGGGENIYAGGQAGASIPYVPEWKLAAGIGFEAGPWSFNLDATWVDETLGTANEARTPGKSTREGVIDDVLLIDLSGAYAVNQTLRLFAGLQNLTDEEYITSRIPHGPRSGAPRSVYAGLELNW